MRFHGRGVRPTLLIALCNLGLSAPPPYLTAQSLSARAVPDSASGLSISAPARARLPVTGAHWHVGIVAETTDGCYLILFPPSDPGDIPWASTIPPLSALEVAVDSTAAGYTWKALSIEAIVGSEPRHCKPAPHLISRRPEVG